MALFARPTFSEILDRVQSDMDSRLDGTDSRLRRSILETIAYIIAGVAYGLYSFIDYLSRQIFVDTAEVEYLNRWGVIWGVERLQAVQASGLVDFAGVDGTLIPSGTELQRSDLALFTTKDDGTIASGAVSIQVIAELPGDTSNTTAGSTLTFTTPIVNINSNAVVAVGGLTGGLDMEDDDSYLERILLKIQQPPQGGAAIDYEIWAKEANAAVTNVFVYPLENGPGTVTVRFMCYGATSNGIPDSTLIGIVQDYINTKKPATANVTVEAPTAEDLDFTIGLTLNPGFVLADVKTNVEAILGDMMRRDSVPGGTIYRNRIIENILAADGVFSANLTSPLLDKTATTSDSILVMGTITWL